MSGFPWIQFYTTDWTAGTRVLTIAAKGAWIDILCALHNSPTRGEISLSVEAWARMLSVSGEDAGRLLSEIKTSNVGDVVMGCNDLVTVKCRRMLREENARKKNRQRVKRHRVASESPPDETPVLHLGNGESNGSVMPLSRGRSQKPEARSQNKTVGRTENPPDDGEWIKSLKTDPAYVGIDVDREIAKCQRWCETNRKQASRKRIVNWLNRCERPIGAIGSRADRVPENLRTKEPIGTPVPQQTFL